MYSRIKLSSWNYFFGWDYNPANEQFHSLLQVYIIIIEAFDRSEGTLNENLRKPTYSYYRIKLPKELNSFAGSHMPYNIPGVPNKF